MGGSPDNSAAPVLCCEHHGDQQKPVKNKHDIFKLASLKKIFHKPTGLHWVTIFYILFALSLSITAVAEVIISAGNIIITKKFNSEISHRVIGTVILAICAAVTPLAIIYSFYAICKNVSKAMRRVSMILISIVIIQILLISFAVTVKQDDIRSLETSLTESFLKSQKEHDRTNIELWDSMQSNLNCCGLHGPEDFRNAEAPFLPAKIPFSCCVAYKKNETESHEKWQRDLCVMNKSYYTKGCIKVMVNALKDMTSVVIGVSILLIILEIITAGIGLYICRILSAAAQSKKEKSDETPTEA